MKVAILICGQPRFTEDFNNTLGYLKGYTQADWFCYFTGDNRGIPSNKLSSDFWREITDISLAASTLQSMLPTNNFIRAFELSDSEYIELPKEPPGIPTPAYKMWYNLYKVNQLRINYEKEHDIVYDMVVRIRPDAGLVTEVDLNTLTKDITDSVITPINKIAGHLHLSSDSPQMCDCFAIASPKNMDIYCDMIRDAHNNFFTQTRHSWHTESAHALHLRNNNVTITPGNFKISIRSDAN
jgi:hypothetical protein